MTKDELTDIIESLQNTQSDTSHVEIKLSEGGFPKKIWETISSFSNTFGGGVIILGIAESEAGIDVRGISNPSSFQKEMQEVCSKMSPPVRALIEIHKYEGKNLLTTEVPEAAYSEKPCFYQGSGMISGSFIRVGESDRRLTQYEVQALLDGRGQPKYDLERVPDSSMEDLDEKLVVLFLKRIREKNNRVRDWTDEKILNHYRVIEFQQDRYVMTLAGIIGLGAYPQKYFPGFVTHVLVYPGSEEGPSGSQGERLIDNVKVEGPILTAVPEIIRAIKRNIQTRTVVKGLFREDMPEYPEVFLREAVVNALVHRDYSPFARGTAVQVKLFPDRIEICSPGGLFGPMTEEGLGTTNLQAARNSFLIKLLEDCPLLVENKTLCENRGTGIPAMIAELKKVGMEPPMFKSSIPQFKVICSNAALLDQRTLAWLEKFAAFDLNDRQRFGLAYLFHKTKLTNYEYSRMNGCDSRIASRELGDLVQKKRVIQNGTRRWAFYTLAGVSGDARPRIGRKDRREEIIAILKKRTECARRDFERILGLQPQTVLYWLRKLIKEGAIVCTRVKAKDPLSKYRLAKPKS